MPVELSIVLDGGVAGGADSATLKGDETGDGPQANRIQSLPRRCEEAVITAGNGQLRPLLVIEQLQGSSAAGL